MNKVEDVLQVGQHDTFKIIKVSKEEQRLGLSLKKSDESAPVESKRMATPKKEARPTARREKREDRVQSGASGSGEKMKSQLQLELEKHAARHNDKSEE